MLGRLFTLVGTSSVALLIAFIAVHILRTRLEGSLLGSEIQLGNLHTANPPYYPVALCLEYVWVQPEPRYTCPVTNHQEMSKPQRIGRRAFVLGYTGEVGRVLTRRLLESNAFERIVLIGRRKVENDGTVDGEAYAKCEQVQVDFDNLNASTFANFDVGFSCMGTTRAKENFYKIEHDYVVNVAKLALDNGCKQFHTVSSRGANANGYLYYHQVKGQVENDLMALNFERVGVFRPAFLLCDRRDGRFIDRLGKTVMKPVIWAWPTFYSVPTDTVAKAIIESMHYPLKDGVRSEIYENARIHELACGYDERYGVKK